MSAEDTDDHSREERANDGERKLVSDVETYGWHVLKVFDDVGAEPDFAYSIGLERTFRHPEIIVIALKTAAMHGIINEIGEEIRKGNRFEPGRTYPDLLEGYDATFRLVPQRCYAEYLGHGRWFYEGDEFRALQFIYPDREGRWPWQEGATDDFKAQQPVLADIPGEP